jgi:hypothetical protein
LASCDAWSERRRAPPHGVQERAQALAWGYFQTRLAFCQTPDRSISAAKMKTWALSITDLMPMFSVRALGQRDNIDTINLFS